MDGVSAVSQSIEAMNDVLKMATQANTEMAEKLVKVNVEMALSPEAGKGTIIDTMA
jgi:hypothetical protein